MTWCKVISFAFILTQLNFDVMNGESVSDLITGNSKYSWVLENTYVTYDTKGFKLTGVLLVVLKKYYNIKCF